MNRIESPYGTWKSPITAAQVASASRSLSEVRVGSQGVFWLEGRPDEGGRVALIRRDRRGSIQDVTSSAFNVRTRVHEYGGGAYALYGQVLFFCNYTDQRVYRLDAADEAPRPITPEPPLPAGLRYADLEASPDGRSLICVQEDHAQPGVQPANRLVLLDSTGDRPARVLASGRDFYASPRLSPDFRHLAWLEWDHPRMPWDGTELRLAPLRADGTLGAARTLAGGERESIVQPEWSRQGALHFVSDRSGWWNLYRWIDGRIEHLSPMEAEFGGPMWALGMRQYVLRPDGSLAAIFSRDGRHHLGLWRPGDRVVEPLDLDWDAFQPHLAAEEDGKAVWTVAASPTEPPSIVRVDLRTRRAELVRRSSDEAWGAELISRPRSFWFPTGSGEQAHAFAYPPQNPAFVAPRGETPPFLVVIHGGPTSSTSTALSPGIQYWTSRGFAVLDVNHRGSTGFGRAYRDRLRLGWGIVDVEDCVNGARHLAADGQVDPRRAVIRGGSAGGYTTLAALAFHHVFRAGAVYYGIGDLEALALHTHKFEAHYLDGLVGPLPQARDEYRRRSPLHAADRISSPVILFQGLEDEVVPPAQSEAMVAALRKKGVPHAYLAFEGEQHGFRRAETRIRCLEAELYFYGRVLGFSPADELEALPIEGL